MKFIIGVDIGTTNCKAVAYSFDGEALAQSSRSYIPLSPVQGYHELVPEQLFDAVCDVITETVAACKDHELIGISFSSAMHGLIAVDESGTPITNMITWADLRSGPYAKALKDTDTGKLLYERTGTPVHAMTPLCKLIWMKNELPRVFHSAFKFISIKEFVFHRFFGKYVIDHSVATSTGMFDIYLLQWNDDALRVAGITEERLSDHVPAGTVIEGLEADIAKRLGIRADLPFVIGGSDGCMAHIGSNAFKPGDVSLTIGTSGAVRTMNPQPIRDERRRIFNYLVTDDLYLSGGPVNNGGNVLQWFARNFLKKNFQSPEEVAAFIDEALSVPAGCEGLVFLPYVYGERAPVWDADAKGIFFGVTASHTVSHFMRAAMEGVSYALYSILEVVEQVSGKANDIYVSGGFIRSPQWVSLLADVLGRDLHVVHAEDSSAAGAAILGMQSLGVVKNWNEASAFFHESEMYRPDMDAHALYMRNYAIYSNLYEKFNELKR